jgi:hypothetical protein
MMMMEMKLFLLSPLLLLLMKQKANSFRQQWINAIEISVNCYSHEVHCRESEDVYLLGCDADWSSS